MNIVETVLDEFAKTQIQNELKENKWVPEKSMLLDWGWGEVSTEMP